MMRAGRIKLCRSGYLKIICK